MDDQTKVFKASRLTAGNLLFPVSIVVTPQHVARVKRRWFGVDEESIAIGKVASVKISTGILWSDIRIDSSGGSSPIESHGHRKGHARQIRELIESYQREPSQGGASGASS